MTNIITNNTPPKVNLIQGTNIETILNNLGKSVIVNEKVYADRNAKDGRKRWEKKRDKILASIQHEINIFSKEDEAKREEYINYWGDENSLNKDKFFSHLEESDSIGDKNVYKRRIVKAEYSYINEETDAFKEDGVTKKTRRVKDKVLGYEVDIMVGKTPLLGSIIDTKTDSETGEVSPIMKKINNKDGSKKIDEVTGKQVENVTWRNNTIKNADGSLIQEGELVEFLTQLKVGFEGDNFKEKLIEIDRSLKLGKRNSTSEDTVSESEDNVSESEVS